MESPEIHSFEGYFLSESALYNIDGSGKRTKMGDVKGDKFIAPGDAESGWRIRKKH
jgi:hypothetical protein